METIGQICAALLMVAGATVVLSFAAIIAYSTFVGIESAIKERKEKKAKK